MNSSDMPLTEIRIQDAIRDVLVSSSMVWPHHHSMLTRLEQNGGHTNINFQGYPISLNGINNSTKDLIQEIETLGFSNFRAGLEQTCVDAHLMIVALSNHPTDAEALLKVTAKYANEIFWFVTGQRWFVKTIRVLPEVDELTSFFDWHRETGDRFMYSIDAHRSGQSATEFLSRLQRSTSFSQRVQTSVTLDDLQIEAQAIAISLSLALKRPIRVDQIKMESGPWKQYSSVTPMQMWGAWQIPAHSASSVAFFPTTYRKGSNVAEFRSSAEKWIGIISKYPGSYYPLELIQMGFWNIFESNNYSGITKRNLSYQGLHFVLTGMDGLTRATDYSRNNPPSIGFRKSWLRILGSNASKSQSKRILGSLYNLRNALAHGDFDSISPALREAKLKLGDTFNATWFDGFSVGVRLHQWLSSNFDSFLYAPELFDELYPEQKDPKPKPRWIIRFKSIFTRAYWQQ